MDDANAALAIALAGPHAEIASRPSPQPPVWAAQYETGQSSLSTHPLHGITNGVQESGVIHTGQL